MAQEQGFASDNLCVLMSGVVASAMKGFSAKQVEPWVESLNRTSFDGRRIVLSYGLPDETMVYLKRNGFDIFSSEQKVHLFIQRFFDLAVILGDCDADKIIWVDSRDLIFQRNPLDWVEWNQLKPILACSEAVKMGDDDWASQNASAGYPYEWKWLKQKESHCAGCIIGDKKYMLALFHDVFRWSLTSSNKNEPTDQAAYNVLINSPQWQPYVQSVKQEEGLAIQMGTTHAKRGFFGNLLMEPPPLILDDGTVATQNGTPFCIVHQYDRDQALKSVIHGRYASSDGA